MSTDSDEQLVGRFVRHGDEDAFSRLYDRHTPALFRIAYRLASQNPTEAADIVQETWLRAASGLIEFRWSSTLRTWLCGIAVNCCREHLRSRAHIFDSDQGSFERPTPAIFPALRIDLETTFQSLSQGYREVLYLHDVEGMTHVEIARILGIDAGTSRSQLYKARRRFRQRFASSDRKGQAHG